jgi:O-antigen/teichoic acid export membrane protein
LHLLKIGAPIFGVGQLYALWIVLDSTLVFKMAGAKGLGLYQLALMTSQGIELIPNALSQVSYPRMAQEYGRTNSITELIKLVTRPMLLLAAFMLFLVPLAWISLPPFIILLLPAYREGISTAQWTLIAVAVQALTPILNIFNVVKRQNLYALALICGISTYSVAVWFFMHQGHGLTAFPKSMLAGRIVFLLVSYYFLMYIIPRSNALPE